MNKKLSLIIALAMSIGISSSSLAAAPSVAKAASTTQSNTINQNKAMNLTLEDALNSLEKNNTSIQLMDEKLLLLNKQYDYDHQNSIDVSDMLYSVNKNSNEYISLKELELIKPQQSAQNVKNGKRDRDDSLKTLRFNMERQYMNVLNNQDQIKNINDSIANVDKQIEKIKSNIDLGMATTDALQQVSVQRSQLVASLNAPKSAIEQSTLNVKQMLNIDLNNDLVLSPAKKDFVKFDDSNMETRINKAVESDYNLFKINKNIEWAKIDIDLNTKYGHNNTTGLVNSQLSLQNLTNSLDNTKLGLQIKIWNSYYNLKNKEDSITAKQVGLENAKQNYNNAVAKFQNGQVDQLEVDSKKLALEKEQILIQNLVNDYMVTVAEFKDMLSE